jgi:hypothetical protein
MRIIPHSLTGRLLLVLLIGLVFALFLSAFILLRDRGQVLIGSIQEGLIARTAGIVRLMDSLPAADRRQLAPLLASPELRISFPTSPISNQAPNQDSFFASELVHRQLLERLPPNSEVKVLISGSVMHSDMPSIHTRHMMENSQIFGPWAYVHGLHAMARHFDIHAKLKDGSWIRFERNISEHLFVWPGRLIMALAILLISVIALSLISVRSIVRPLNDLKKAAEGLGKNIQQAPFKEDGPVEVRDTAKAFNTMQIRLKNYIEDRAGILAAVSHDLKTPLTRIRLRTDLMEDDELRVKMQKDLDDMEAMVTATLDFMRGTETREPSQQVDIMALLESI